MVKSHFPRRDRTSNMQQDFREAEILEKIRVGLVGYGRAGQAVANILGSDPHFDLRWIVRRSPVEERLTHPGTDIPVLGLDRYPFALLFDEMPVDALVDFSSPQSLRAYGEEVRKRGVMLLSAISAYTEEDMAYARELGRDTRVMCSPNITLGINFLIVAAKLLRKAAPFADVQIVEQHFRDKLFIFTAASSMGYSRLMKRRVRSFMPLPGWMRPPLPTCKSWCGGGFCALSAVAA